MGSIPLKNGEHVYKHDGSGSMDPAAISAAEASNLANLMKNRQRFDYVWANASERTAQTGMVQSSRGYQLDTKTEWLYDDGNWHLALPYIEFSGSTLSLAASTYTAQTGWSVDIDASTDTTMVTVSGGVFTFVRAGIYSFSCTAKTTDATDDPFQALTRDVAHLQFMSIAPYSHRVGTLVVPFMRIQSDNTPMYLWAWNGAITDLTNRVVRIGRLG